MIEPTVLFVKQFLASLFSNKVRTIPINNDKFNNGIDNMAIYFNEHKEKFGPQAEKLEQLFRKYSTKGDYSEFERIIENFNGRFLSLENPYYVKANINFKDDYDKILLNNEKLMIKREVYQDLVTCFCEGAEIYALT